MNSTCKHKGINSFRRRSSKPVITGNFSFDYKADQFKEKLVDIISSDSFSFKKHFLSDKAQEKFAFSSDFKDHQNVLIALISGCENKNMLTKKMKDVLNVLIDAETGFFMAAYENKIKETLLTLKSVSLTDKVVLESLSSGTIMHLSVDGETTLCSNNHPLNYMSDFYDEKRKQNAKESCFSIEGTWETNTYLKCVECESLLCHHPDLLPDINIVLNEAFNNVKQKFNEILEKEYFGYLKLCANKKPDRIKEWYSYVNKEPFSVRLNNIHLTFVEFCLQKALCETTFDNFNFNVLEKLIVENVSLSKTSDMFLVYLLKQISDVSVLSSKTQTLNKNLVNFVHVSENYAHDLFNENQIEPVNRKEILDCFLKENNLSLKELIEKHKPLFEIEYVTSAHLFPKEKLAKTQQKILSIALKTVDCNNSKNIKAYNKKQKTANKKRETFEQTITTW